MKPMYVCNGFTNKHANEENTRDQCSVCSSQEMSLCFKSSDIENLIKGRRNELETGMIESVERGNLNTLMYSHKINELNFLLAALEEGER